MVRLPVLLLSVRLLNSNSRNRLPLNLLLQQLNPLLLINLQLLVLPPQNRLLLTPN